MIRVFDDIPNVAFRAIIQQYAVQVSQPVFTVREETAALVNYTFFAITRN
ncbi:MAG TPA: hypothetical protein VGN00_14025 [Puia sp.]|jgi:hypothetical protein